ncbi:MAG: hypothetical protein ACYTHJ_04180 [Planctomycetota bacterium]
MTTQQLSTNRKLAPTAAMLCTTAALTTIALTGCAKKEEPIAWIPKPLVEWNAVTTGLMNQPQDTYRIVVAQPTKGLFPASISVSRLAKSEDAGSPYLTSPELLRDPRNEFLQWNTAFDDQMAVSEVFPLDTRNLGGRPAHPNQIMSAMKALGGRIGLIYAVNEIAEDKTEMFGTLYETGGFRPLATMHAIAHSSPVDYEEGDKEFNLFVTNSNALVRRKFENMVYDVIRQLIINDEPAEVESSEGWVPDRPLRPAEWPPRRRN